LTSNVKIGGAMIWITILILVFLIPLAAAGECLNSLSQNGYGSLGATDTKCNPDRNYATNGHQTGPNLDDNAFGKGYVNSLIDSPILLNQTIINIANINGEDDSIRQDINNKIVYKNDIPENTNLRSEPGSGLNFINRNDITDMGHSNNEKPSISLSDLHNPFPEKSYYVENYGNSYTINFYNINYGDSFERMRSNILSQSDLNCYPLSMETILERKAQEAKICERIRKKNIQLLKRITS